MERAKVLVGTVETLHRASNDHGAALISYQNHGQEAFFLAEFEGFRRRKDDDLP